MNIRSMSIQRRRLVVLTVLVLALPTAVLANSISSSADPTFVTGTFVRGTASRTVAGGFAAGNLLVNVIGSSNHIRVSTHVLSAGCNVAVGTCTFLTGVVTVLNPLNNAVLFTDNIANGMVTKNGDDVTILASLVGPAGGSTRLILNLGAGTSLDAGSGIVSTPETSALEGLLLGMIGLAGMTRRKLMLGT